MSLENHGGGVSSGALLQKCNVLNDATLNIASRHFQPAGAGATVVAGAATFGNIQITATNAGDVSGAIINSINAVGNSVKTLEHRECAVMQHYVAAPDAMALLVASERGRRVEVVDVRDSDFEGGHIRGARHIPAYEFASKATALARALVGSDGKQSSKSRGAAPPLVLVHCMFSKQRGPRCAAILRAELGRVQSGQRWEVAVLQGGFSAFVNHLLLLQKQGRLAQVLPGGVEEMVEDYDRSVWGWEQDSEEAQDEGWAAEEEEVKEAEEAEEDSCGADEPEANLAAGTERSEAGQDSTVNVKEAEPPPRKEQEQAQSLGAAASTPLGHGTATAACRDDGGSDAKSPACPRL
eukprot:g31892.t1